jgi:membrane-bound lytic murein transglycosylase A
MPARRSHTDCPGDTAACLISTASGIVHPVGSIRTGHFLVAGLSAFCLFLLLCQFGCTPRNKESGKPYISLVPDSELPEFADDLDTSSVRTAIERSLTFLDKVPGDRAYHLGDLSIRADRIRASLVLFLKLAEAGRLDKQTIARNFDVYGFNTGESPEKILLTGYYEPILDARLAPDAKFCYPLYGVPSDLLSIDLSAFDPARFSGERLVGRLDGKRVVPYYTRAEIDGQGKLGHSGSQLAWLDNPVDAFFLQVQGSGMLRLPGGQLSRIGYAAANGRPYRSIGKYLISKGVMSADEMSLQAIRSYLEAHPEALKATLWYNESYVFFRWVKEGPMGSIGAPLTAGRSIATDPKYYPQAALAFLESEKPSLDSNGNVTAWEAMHRWVLNQDTGGAIKSSGRVDLFCGSGETAAWVAGRLKHPGRLYFLLKKSEAEK